MNCHRCGAWLLADIVHLEDTPNGLYAVVDAPVADHVIACRCGLDVAVSSTLPAVHHPCQIRMMQGAA